jgi:hypothetical protein
MASRFVLDKLDLDFAAALLLASLGLVVVVIVIAGAIDRVVVGNERVVADVVGGHGVVGTRSSRMHVEGALAFTHRICGRRRIRV